MASDQVVNAKDVLQAIMEVRRLGRQHAMELLERSEADLCEYLLEELTRIHARLGDTGITARQLRRITARIETMALVLVTALRKARIGLWRDGESSATSTPASPHDPPAQTPPPSPPTPPAAGHKQSPSGQGE